jgi:hypothetical protein
MPYLAPTKPQPIQAARLTQCNTSTQVVRAGTTSCVATTDAFGNWGVWALAGQYEYTITINGTSSGPYPVTIGGTGSGGGGTGIVSAGSTGQFAYYASDGTTVSPNANLLEGSGAFSYTGSIFSIGSVGSSTGSLILKGATSGQVIQTVNPIAGTYSLLWPATTPLSGQVLSSDACPGTVCTLGWINPSSGGSGIGTGAVNQIPIYNSTSGIIGDTLLTDVSNKLTYAGTGMNFTNAQAGGIVIQTTSDNSSITMGGTSKFTIQGGSVSGAAQDVRILGGPGSSTGFGSNIVIKAGSSTVNAAQSLSPGWVYIYGGTNTSSAGGGIGLAAGYGGATPYHVMVGCNGSQNFGCSNGQAVITGTLDIVGKTQNAVALTVADSNPSYITLKLPGSPGTAGQSITTDGCPANVCTLSFSTVSGGGGGVSGGGTTNKLALWNGATLLGNAAASDNGTTFAVNEDLVTSILTAATNVSNVNSPFLKIGANYWDGAASQQDLMRFRNISGSGSNPTQTLVIDHTGSSGVASVSSALPFTLSGGVTFSGGTVTAASATKTVPSITGAGVPSNATCTISGQMYFRTDAGDPGNPVYWCNGSVWTVQSTSGGSGAWNSLTNPGGNLALSMGNNTTTWTAGTATTSPFLIQDTTGNTGTGALFAVNTVGTSTAAGISVTTVGGTAMTLQAGSASAIALSIPLNQGTVKLNTITSTSANPSATGSIRFGATDPIRYGCTSCSSGLTTTGTTDMNLIRGNGANGPALVGDYLGINVAGPIGTFAAGGALQVKPTAATGNGNGGI